MAEFTAKQEPADDGRYHPWEEPDKKAAHAEIKKLYRLMLDPDWVPADPVMGRMLRIWRKRGSELMALEKMRSQTDDINLAKQPPKERHVGGNLYEREESAAVLQDLALLNLEQILDAIKLHCNAIVAMPSLQEALMLNSVGSVMKT